MKENQFICLPIILILLRLKPDLKVIRNPSGAVLKTKL